MTIILPVFLLVCPFFGNVVIFFISHFHFAQKTLSRKSLGTHSSLEESFTGLIDWKAAKLDSGQNCNELNWIIDTVTIPLPGSIIESCIKVLVPFQFVDKILKWDHPNESYWAAVSCGIVRDANLWRPKIGRLSFFHYPPRNFNNLPPRNIDPAPNGNDLEHYMASYMIYILSKFEIIVLMLEIIFVSD